MPADRGFPLDHVDRITSIGNLQRGLNPGNTTTGHVALYEILDYRTASSLPGGTFVATAHSTLTGLDYASAGHTGFADAGGGTNTNITTLSATTAMDVTAAGITIAGTNATSLALGRSGVHRIRLRANGNA